MFTKSDTVLKGWIIAGVLLTILIVALITHGAGTIQPTFAEFGIGATIPILMLIGAAVFYSQDDADDDAKRLDQEYLHSPNRPEIK